MPQPTKNCKYCGEPIVEKTPTRRLYCSDAHKLRASRRRQRAPRPRPQHGPLWYDGIFPPRNLYIAELALRRGVPLDCLILSEDERAALVAACDRFSWERGRSCQAPGRDVRLGRAGRRRAGAAGGDPRRPDGLLEALPGLLGTRERRPLAHSLVDTGSLGLVLDVHGVPALALGEVPAPPRRRPCPRSSWPTTPRRAEVVRARGASRDRPCAARANHSSTPISPRLR